MAENPPGHHLLHCPPPTTTNAHTRTAHHRPSAISGTGAPFCAGEMTVTRAAVRLDSGEMGFGYVGGRDTRHAETAAAIDALGQRADWTARLDAEILTPLAQEAEARHRLIAARAAATKVDFFTVAREAGT